ncbi:class I SAM-dependent methyltransferase [Candidatus Parcubacteria bacterium]|nr:MAG: class I SAM-dependent methyltransferase [Candidatus Parcubacteria bacterium]
MGTLKTKIISKDVAVNEAKYWSRFEEEVARYGIPIWVDYQKANTPEIGFINFSTDPEIDRIVLGEIKDSFIKTVKGGKALDLGCGAGWLCLEIARKGASATGIDISPERIRKAKQYARQEGAEINYSIDDLEKLKWAKKGYYNVIVNWNSLHHVKNVEAVLLSIKNSLSSNGLFVSWDHLGDNFLLKSATFFASLIPGYYKKKKDVLGSIHSESEGIAEIRLTEKVVAEYFQIKLFKRYLIFIHLLPPIYKYLKFKIGIPIPRNLFVAFLRVVGKIDRKLVSVVPFLATYSFFVGKKVER